MRNKKATSSPPRQINPSSSRIYKWFRSYVRSLTAAGSEDAQSNRLIMIGWVAIFGFPLYGWIWSAVYPQVYENFPLRFLGMAIAFPFLFSLRIQEKKWMELYSYAAITYMAPYFFTFMFLMNDGSSVWSQSLLIAVVALFLFDGRFATISWLSGTALAYLAFSLANHAIVMPSSAVLVNLPIDMFAILLVSVTKVSRRIIEEEKLNGMASVLGSISHELRTPLLSVHASAKGLNQYVPPLVAFYKKHSGLAVAAERVPIRQLDMTVPAIERIQTEVQSMNSAIDLLLANAGRAKDKPQMVQDFSIKDLIASVVQWYPFESDKHRALVTLDIQSDFRVEANMDLMSMVIVNLLKNALRAVARARKGDIRIIVEANSQGGKFIVRDTGCGIPRSQIAHIFTRFYTYPAHEGTGIGLAFCRETLASWGAKIACRSEEGAFCEFEIQFKSTRSHGTANYAGTTAL
jgi:two-component system CAI-1 autoinducer sensor kinase/phosphatase CqsS